MVSLWDQIFWLVCQYDPPRTWWNSTLYCCPRFQSIAVWGIGTKDVHFFHWHRSYQRVWKLLLLRQRIVWFLHCSPVLARQIDCMEMQEFQNHSRHTVCKEPRVGHSEPGSNLKRMLHSPPSTLFLGRLSNWPLFYQYPIHWNHRWI